MFVETIDLINAPSAGSPYYCFSLTDLIIADQASGHISGQSYDIRLFCYLLHKRQDGLHPDLLQVPDLHPLLLPSSSPSVKCFCCFRVRIAYGWEISIRKFLLRNYIYVFEIQVLLIHGVPGYFLFREVVCIQFSDHLPLH